MTRSLRWSKLVTALVILFATACTGQSRNDGQREGESTLARAETGARSMADVGGEGAGPERGGEHASLEEGSERSESGDEGEHSGSEGGGEHASSEGRGEHAGGEHSESDGEGEESGEPIRPEATWDATRNGARLVLAFDPASTAFVGRVENTTQATLCDVRVEVHLSTGTELGPTKRMDLAPGETAAVKLPTSGESFESWTAHPEISRRTGA